MPASAPLPLQNTFDLPAVARELVALLGCPDALTLIQRYGGSTLQIPKRVGRAPLADDLCDLIGEEAAALLFREHGGFPLYVPRCATALMRLRNRKIVAEADARCRSESMTSIVQDLAIRYRLSNRRIWEIMKTLPE